MALISKDFFGDSVKRAVGSLMKVTADGIGNDLLLKSVTFLNLVKKAVCSKMPLTVWRYGDCGIKVTFFGEIYNFYLPNGYDFNIFLNPYFHEYDITRLVFNSLSEGDVFLDIGAHGGLYTIMCGKAVGITGRVLSFEPNPLNLHFLRLNIKLNGLNNVIVIPKAVGDKKGKIRLFYSQSETALTSADRNGKNIIETQVTTIDEVAKMLDFVRVMKIDTEGYDYNVLRGALKTLRKTYCVIVEQNTFDVRKLLVNCGFHLSTLNPSGYLLGTNNAFKDILIRQPELT